MDENGQIILGKRIAETMENLRRNRMQPYFVTSRTEVVPKVQELLREGDTVAAGGSMTLEETGVLAHLRSGRYRFLDRGKPGLSPEEIRAVYTGAFSADAYLLSANAITQNGELYNVDGNSNRVAALLYGPKASLWWRATIRLSAISTRRSTASSLPPRWPTVCGSTATPTACTRDAAPPWSIPAPA